MTFLYVILGTFWGWEFFRVLTSRLSLPAALQPLVVAAVAVQLAGYHHWRMALAAAGAVGVLHVVSMALTDKAQVVQMVPRRSARLP